MFIFHWEKFYWLRSKSTKNIDTNPNNKLIQWPTNWYSLSLFKIAKNSVSFLFKKTPKKTEKYIFKYIWTVTNLMMIKKFGKKRVLWLEIKLLTSKFLILLISDLFYSIQGRVIWTQLDQSALVTDGGFIFITFPNQIYQNWSSNFSN